MSAAGDLVHRRSWTGSFQSSVARVQSVSIQVDNEEYVNPYSKKNIINKDGQWDRQRLLCNLLLEFAKNTTLHGLRYVTERGLSVVEKIFWVVSFVLSLALCIILMHNVWDKWQTNQVIATFSERLTYVSEVPFPAVTVCPQAKIDQRIYNYTKNFNAINDALSPTDSPDDDIDIYDIIADYYSGKITQGFVRDFGRIRLVCKDFSGLTNIIISEMINNTIDGYEAVQKIIEVAPKRDDIFSIIRWHSPFQIWWHPFSVFNQVLTEEGVCYTFNSLAANEILNTDRPLSHCTKDAGGTFSLYRNADTLCEEAASSSVTSYVNLTLRDFCKKCVRWDPMNLDIQKDYNYLDANITTRGWSSEIGYSGSSDDEYPRRGRANSAGPTFSLSLKEKMVRDEECDGNQRGFKVYLHHPGDLPQTSIYYYTAVPGQDNSFAVSVDVVKSSASLVRCPVNSRQCYFPGERSLKYFRIYSQSNCRLECIANHTLAICRCVMFHMPHNNSTVLCSFLTIHDCVVPALEEYISEEGTTNGNSSQCNCLPSCNSIQYQAEVFKTNTKYKNSENETIIEMYFKKPVFVSRVRECTGMFELTDFLAYCGGLLGLFLGFSFLSLVEIFYFCTLRMGCMCRKVNQADKKENTSGLHEEIS